MRVNPALFLHFLFLGCAASGTGCSSQAAQTGDDAGPYGRCIPFVDDGGASAQVAFPTDVAPIFQTNCTSGAFNCHGTAQNLPYLGSADGGAVEAAAILASIVGVTSPEDPSMQIIAPGAPAQSYLMHKIDWDQCTLLAECDANTFGFLNPRCGNNMPNGGAMLPLAVRNTIRAWIRQGAGPN